MPRQKRNSQAIEKAQRRLESLESIESNLDFGHEISTPMLRHKLEQARQAMSHYNTLLSKVDEAQKTLEAIERETADLSTRLLKSVAARYGTTSVEYMKAGGKPRSNSRKTVATTAPAASAPATDLPRFSATATPLSGVNENGKKNGAKANA
jgi:SHS2 domain-containing protein